MIRALVLVILAGCAEAPISDTTTAGVGGKADGGSATITFDRGWNETADAPLTAGEAVQIVYDLDRLTTCRGTDAGSQVWGITGFAKFGDQVKEFAVSRLDGGAVVPVIAEVAIPSGTQRMEMWFRISNKWGCTAYDSNLDANYAFDVQSATASSAVLAFEPDWTETASGPIHGGDRLVVHYDPVRLSKCSGSTHGHAAWGVSGYFQTDGGAVHGFAASKADGGTLLPADTEITVPHGHDLALWFEATSIWGCHEYDSNFGANYHFEVE